MVNDAVRVRVIRAILGISSKEFSSRVGVTQGVITSWEKGRSRPQPKNKIELGRLCRESKIAFTASGFPVVVEDAPQEKNID